MSLAKPEQPNNEDCNLDLTLRPRSLDEYVGQEKIKNNQKSQIKD